MEDCRLLWGQFSITSLKLEIHSCGRPLAELQVTNVKASLTKRPFDTAVQVSVQSLLIVDALQTYGHDYELLVASHKHVMYVLITISYVQMLDVLLCILDNILW